MTNLSELSKPVAWKLHHHDRYYFEENADVVAIAESMAQAKGDAVYSQEYVSALLAERDAFEASALALRDEWRARGECIAELERANQSQEDHINQQQDRIESLEKKNGDLGRAFFAAEKRLATPVRLTDERTLWAGEDDYDTGHVKGWNANRIEQAALLKKQGFTVEGDE